jgi:DNA-binding response OmpR family regulator
MATASVQVREAPVCLQNATAPAAKRQECVLLIEDDEDAVFLVRHALEEYGNGGYHLAWADSLSDGLEQLSKGRVDIVLLDLGLPDNSGPASYAWVREIAPKVPVIVVTGDMCAETERSVLASGAEDYLLKTRLSGQLLLHAIRAALSANKRSNPRDIGSRKLPQRYCKKFK